MKVEDSTLAVVRALERMGVRHYVRGSLASSLHGEPRATNDADIVAELKPSDGGRLQKELGDRFYVDPEEFAAAVANQRSFNLVDEVELAKVDVFCVRAEEYQAEALERTVRLALDRAIHSRRCASSRRRTRSSRSSAGIEWVARSAIASGVTFRAWSSPNGHASTWTT